MGVWLAKVSETSHKTEERKTYFVYGSGLIAVPYHRMNEIPRLKAQFHSDEVSWAMTAARTRKIA